MILKNFVYCGWMDIRNPDNNIEEFHILWLNGDKKHR